MARPASSIPTYSTPGIIVTPRFFRSVRRIHPVVFASPSPTLPGFRCRSHRRRGAGRSSTAPMPPRSRYCGVDAPLGAVLLGLVVTAVVREELADVEADAAGADDRDALARHLATHDDVGVAGDLRMIDAGNRRRARHDAGREHDVIEALELVRLDAAIEMERDTRALDDAAIVAKRLRELVLPRNAAREIELAADLGGGVEQRDGVARFCRRGRAREPGRAGADDGDPLLPRRGLHDDQRLVAGPRIDEARGDLAREDLVEARLVAGDARVDLVGAPGRRLVDELRVGEKRPRHRHHVAVAAREHRLGHRRIVDPVGRDQRNRHLALEPPRHPRERGARHHRRDRRHARLVPADAGVDDRGARRLHRLGERHDLLPRAAAVDEIEHRQPEDDDEARRRPPRASCARSRPESGSGSRTRRPSRRCDGSCAARRTR